ncbi:MAG: TetR/AcrR family transcriptional regulator [Polyangiaceae bacterium]|nr:TetR/AcrR family transcriptional regulator [Polyangiaceae bacterium]MCB9606944.1 TetR/AcrR family transcriptional regulator [Polyangiaceae bacterium]
MGTAAVRKPSQSRAKRTRASLVAAAEAEFTAHGYAQTTARSIAERAGVATGTFYQYFGDKDVMLRELADVRQQRIAREAVEVLGDDVRDVKGRELLAAVRSRMTRIVLMVMDYHRENPGLHAVLTERRHADSDLDQLTSLGEQALVHQVAQLLARWGFAGDTTATAFVLFGMVEGSVHAHVLGTSVVDDDRFTSALVDALIRVALPELDRD